MDLTTQIHIAATVLSFVAFVGIMWWALGRSRRERFAKDAHAPFALRSYGPFTARAEAETWMRKCAAESRIGQVDDIGWDGLYKLLAKEMHPDMPGGNADLWERLDAAATLLGVRGNSDARS